MVHNERRKDSRSRGERNMKLIKKILIALLIVIGMVLMSISPSEPEGEVPPFMSNISYIPERVYARGKAKIIKKKTLKREYESLGEYVLTAYCSCSRCSGGWGSKTATGTKCKEGRTIAVDPNKIPYGSTVVINGHEYVAEDCGGGIKGNHIDIYFNSHQECLEFGRQKAEVFIKKKPKLITKLKTIKG